MVGPKRINTRWLSAYTRAAVCKFRRPSGEQNRDAVLFHTTRGKDETETKPRALRKQKT